MSSPAISWVSASTALWALRGAGCRSITIVNRSLDRARELAAPGETALDGADPGVPGAVRAASLLINTTSLGWRADDPAPLATDLLHGGLLVYDMVYRQTPLLAAAQATHSPVASGIFGADMQVHLVNDGPVTFNLHIT